MLVDFSTLTGDAAYFAMIQALIPRPIAWVLSDNGDDTLNLAPFSFFTGICGDPPLIMISVGRKPDGTRKDTWVNIEEREQFVLHIVPREMASQMVASSATLAHGDSELSQLNLATVAITDAGGGAAFRLPRLVGPRVAMCCTRHAIHEVGRGPQGMILGEVQSMYLEDGIVTATGGRLQIDAKLLDPVARLGGGDYAMLGEVFTIARPK